MNKVNIADDYILEMSGFDKDRVQRGYEYFKLECIDIIQVYRNTAVGYAIGTSRYTFRIVTDNEGYLEDFSCTCPAFDRKPEELCKHIIGGMFELDKRISRQEKSEEERRKEIKNKAIKGLIGYMMNISRKEKSTSKKSLKMEFFLEKREIYSQAYYMMRVKIGEDKTYFVKSMKNFIESYINNETIVLGKNFKGALSDYDLTQNHKKFMEYISKIFKIEKDGAMIQTAYVNRETSIFKGAYAHFSIYTLGDVLDCILGENIKYTKGLKEVEALVEAGDLNMKFFLEEDDSSIILKKEEEYNLELISLKPSYVLENKRLLKLDEEYMEKLLPVLAIGENEELEDIEIPLEYQGDFITEAIPVIKDLANVSVQEELKGKFVQEDLQIEVFLDRHLERINLKVNFIYGELKLNPFANQVIDTTNLLRDRKREEDFIEILLKYGFMRESDSCLLEDEDSVYEFLSKGVEELLNIGEVYYSEEFNKMSIRNMKSPGITLKLAKNESLLDFSFEMPKDIDEHEFIEILKSTRKKAKYHRLKNGDFLSLEDESLEDFDNLAKALGISDKELVTGSVEVQKFKGFFIDEYLNEHRNIESFRSKSFKSMIENIKSPMDGEYEIPTSLEKTLRGYQKVGFQWMKSLKEYGLAGILADDMGLGKTLQVISVLTSELKNSTKAVLVVAPTSLVYNWKAEILKFAPELKVTVIDGSKKERESLIENIDSYQVAITSYPLIRRDLERYEEKDFLYCILDEAQHIKNPATQAAKAVKCIKSDYKIAMTGTPIENSLTELWSIFDFLMPGYLHTHQKFLRDYEKPIVLDNNKKALKILIDHVKPFILRRMKKDVLQELPDKIETKISVEMEAQQKKVYMAQLKVAQGELKQELLEQGYNKSQMKILSMLTRLRQVCCHPSLLMEEYKGDSGKLEALKEIVQDGIESGKHILIFSQFTSMLHIISKELQKMDISHLYLDGETKTSKRMELVNSFQNGQAKIFLISLKAGGTGLNLTRADMVIHYDPWWNPSVEDQATDRAHRIGQKKAVQVYKFVTTGTIEEKIFELQEDKKNLIDSVIKPGQTMLSKLSEDELKRIFEISI